MKNAIIAILLISTLGLGAIVFKQKQQKSQAEETIGGLSNKLSEAQVQLEQEEQQTAKLPSDTFLWFAVGAMATSAILQASGKQHVSLFVGQWAPTLLIFGLYNKLVKQLGSDRTERAF